MKLSDHFTFEELTRNGGGMECYDLQATLNIIDRLTRLAIDVLEPIRAQFGPLRITSGYRSPAHNASVGGAATSQHLSGEAADFVVMDGTPPDVVVRWAVEHKDLCPFDQIIAEFGRWVHVSHRKDRNRGQALVAVRGKGGSMRYAPFVKRER